MITQTRKTIVQGVLLVLVFILGMSGTSRAAEYWLRAEVATKTMPDASVITMWGFALCTDGTYTSCSPATVPGPELTVPAGDTTLTIHLRNNITGLYTEPVSIVIPGQTITPTPVRNPDGRVRSFTTETPADNSTTVDYIWSSLKPGTYLYQSGTHPAVQVQMGLYGAVKHDAAAGQAYDAATAYTSEAVLLFSEIDPLLHITVALGDYGPGLGITSTMNYEPKYFLINGAPYSASSAPIPAGNAGTKTLLRFLNAGLKSRVPTLNGLNLSLVAEDGNKYLYPREQYSLLLSAGKTMDALITPTRYGTYAIFDRRLGLTNAAVSGGGMLTYFSVGTGSIGGIGIFRGGLWYLDTNLNGVYDSGIDSTFNFGIAGDKPVVGDWTGTGTSKIGVFRNGLWYLDTDGNGAYNSGTDTVTTFGISGDIPVTGAWTGTGTTNIGVARSTANGMEWYLDINGNGVWDQGIDRFSFFGIAGDVPVTGDWDGSGVTKVGVFRNGLWYLDMNGNGVWDQAQDLIANFGIPGDAPVSGDWDGTGVTKIGIFRNGLWYLDTNGNGAWDGGIDTVTTFGIAGDVPVAGRW